MRITENDSIGDEEDRANEQGFAEINVMKDEALGYGKRKKQPTTYASDK